MERFQQTLKKWLAAQPDQPATVQQLQALLDRFVQTCNQHRPHRSLPQRATRTAVYTAGDPGWPRHDLQRRPTMRFDTTCEVVDDPRAAVRRLWERVR